MGNCPAETTDTPDGDSPLSLAEELRDSARRIRELERVRVQLAHTLLNVQEACATTKDADHAQRLLSAAVRDLEDLDARLFEARTYHDSMESCGDALAS
ncbi:hypothetical protein BJ994_000498 [Arthrobacter pigmenti]|uniref:Uncharacterized protein n=1 Tax=Arthrobacter pigmenti TaxID=271432 RepID=A0A846RL95_9MICC|nr:hypothetical protein [Arthrobacter pigmenti]NJC21422.1 hypothetical protein [Arthrobacter pigmenti]